MISDRKYIYIVTYWDNELDRESERSFDNFVEAEQFYVKCCEDKTHGAGMRYVFKRGNEQ